MNPGKLDTPIVIEAPITTKGSRGETNTEWVFFATVWGKIEYGMEGDTPDAFRMAGEQAIAVTIRWRSGIERKCRMKINGEYYYISGVGVQGRKQYLIIDATTKN